MMLTRIFLYHFSSEISKKNITFPNFALQNCLNVVQLFCQPSFHILTYKVDDIKMLTLFFYHLKCSNKVVTSYSLILFHETFEIEFQFFLSIFVLLGLLWPLMMKVELNWTTRYIKVIDDVTWKWKTSIFISLSLWKSQNKFQFCYILLPNPGLLWP